MSPAGQSTETQKEKDCVWEPRLENGDLAQPRPRLGPLCCADLGGWQAGAVWSHFLDHRAEAP